MLITLRFKVLCVAFKPIMQNVVERLSWSQNKLSNALEQETDTNFHRNLMVIVSHHFFLLFLRPIIKETKTRERLERRLCIIQACVLQSWKRRAMSVTVQTCNVALAVGKKSGLNR